MKTWKWGFAVAAIIAVFVFIACDNGTAGNGTYTVTYNGNGNTGGAVPTDSNSPYQNGATVTVLGNTGSLVKMGHTFFGWNTAANGSGTSYTEGSTFTISVNTILYAQWTPTSHSLTYNGNGNTGGAVPTDSNSPYQNGATVTVLGNTESLVKVGHTFSGWNTAANRSGTQYMAGDTFTIETNTTLYAQWEWEDPTTATPLSINVWVEGSIAEETEQWFKFTSTKAKNYIHLNYTGIGYAYVQIFSEFGVAIGENQFLSSGYGTQRPDAAGSFSRDFEIGQVYYICVQQAYPSIYDTGAYRIALTETNESPNMIILPDDEVFPLTANTWTDGDQSQWYSFTATASMQYIHILPGTQTAFWLQVYGSNGGTIGNAVSSSGSVAAGPWELETSKTYYIKLPYYAGTFQMAFNDSTTPPPVVLPTENYTTLIANTWADGTTSGGEWYRFTANAVTQYIHFNFTTATGASVKVYDSTGNMVGTQNSVPVTASSFSRELANGSMFYLYVTKESYDGAFQIAFNASETPPAIYLPIDGITELTVNTWAPGSIDYNGKQWFRFTANASPQYVHLSDINIGLSVRLYDMNGNAIGNPIYIRANSNNSFLSQPVISGQIYYVKTEGLGYTEDNYKVSFNDSETPPELE